ncbi:hypothetical protein MRX96_020408 [Rhipicephalus microplus]
MTDEPVDPLGDFSGTTSEPTTRTVTTTYNAPGQPELQLPACATTSTQAVNEHAALRTCFSSPDFQENTTNTGSRLSPTAESALPRHTILLNSAGRPRMFFGCALKTATSSYPEPSARAAFHPSFRSTPECRHSQQEGASTAKAPPDTLSSAKTDCYRCPTHQRLVLCQRHRAQHQHHRRDILNAAPPFAVQLTT